MDKYRVVNNGIWIPATPGGISLYDVSKNVINDNTILIDKIIKGHSIFKSKLEKELATDEKFDNNELIELLNNILKFKDQFCFFLHFNMDLSICARELMLAPTRPEQQFYTKVIYIDLYRYLERHNSDLGIIKKLSNLSEEYKEYHDCYLRFRNDYYQEIRNYRNMFYAHFDSQFKYKKYYELAANLDADIVGKLFIRFYETQQRLSSIYLSIEKNLQNKIQSITDN